MTENGVLGFLKGGGEVAHLIQAFDWKKTPLGPIENWPAVTRAATSLILHSPVPMVALWGESGIMIYNDAYSRIAGQRHPALLGSEVRKGWPEVAEWNDNVMKVGLAGGTLSFRDQVLVLSRQDIPEDVWLDLDYSPITDEDGRPVGVIAVVIENSDKAAAQRALRENESRLRFLDALGRETAKSTDADAILAVTTRMLGEFLGVSICAYADMEPDQDHFTIRGDWSAPGSPSIVGYYSLADFGKRAVANLSAGEPLVLNDNLKELPPEEAATFQAIGIGSTICMPLVKEGRLTALMAIHHKGPHRWTDNELALLTEVTERSWAHIERVRSAAVLRQREEMLRLATDAAAIGTWDFNPVTGELNWDTRCKAVFGLPADAAVTYEGTFLAGLHPDDRTRIHTSVQQALEPGGVSTFDVEYRTIGLSDGMERWIAATGRAVFADGRAVRFIGTVQDITARKRSEMALAEETRALDLLNNTASKLSSELDLDRLVQTVVDAGVAFSGAQFGAFFYNVTDDQGGSYMLYALSGVDPSHFSKFPMPRNTAIFAPTFAGEGIVRSGDITRDPRYGKNAPHNGMPKGHLPVRSYLAVPVISRSGEVIGGLFFGHEKTNVFDIKSERLMHGLAAQAAIGIDNARLFQAGQRLNQTLESRVEERTQALLQAQQALQQAQKMEAIGSLTGGIAHDFNNLLMAVSGSLELLRKRVPQEPGLARLIDNAMEGARRGTSLTQRMLAFARRQDLKRERISIPALVRDMGHLLQTALGPTAILKTEFPAHLPCVETDPNQLESALLNLCLNARDASHGDGPIVVSGRIMESAGQANLKPGTYVCLSVTDAGEGMDEETLKRATEPFFTTKGVGRGTGLGLSMVHGFSEQSGGQLLIHSRKGSGTTAEIWLPAAGIEEGERAAIVVPHPLDTPMMQGLRVLSVDDDSLVLMNSVEMLEDLGHIVTGVGSAAEALALLRSGERFDLVITDHAMPQMTGSQLAQEAVREQPSLKVLLATGYAELPIGEIALPRLAKPYSQSELANAIESLMIRQNRF